ncbi:MAG: tetratricopeptide repeat protein, partial [Tannerella sp.]|nr:tetratricopeptide repeat protein [Tannerella sp.]
MGLFDFFKKKPSPEKPDTPAQDGHARQEKPIPMESTGANTGNGKRDNLVEKRQIRIFISSTFRDMEAERNYLITKVFPKLRQYCQERDVTLFELDLRWGISEEEAKQGKVVDICLYEIENTHPFFIGLLGERYGWIPTARELAGSQALEKYDWISADVNDGLSITEMEMQYGVLRSPENLNAYFYLRSLEMPIPSKFREKKGSPEAQKLSHLKDKIRTQTRYPVQVYNSPEDLGKRVQADFEALVNKLFPQGALSALERERLQHKAFLNSRTGIYIAEQKNYNRLNGFVKSEAQTLVIAGESGMGKSALLANWIEKYATKLSGKLICHFTGNSAAEGDYRKIMQRLIDEIRDLYGLPKPADNDLQRLNNERGRGNNRQSDGDKQKEELQQLLARIASKERLLIVLDGLNQLADTDNAKLLNWLPAFPNNVKVIYSTVTGDATLDTFHRREYAVYTLQPLTPEARKELITGYLKRYGKGLLPAQTKRIAENKEMENTLALRTLLDELRVSGVHEKLNTQINRYLAAPDIPAFFDLVLERLESVYNYGKTNFVGDVFSLFAVSQAGLSEAELLTITGVAPLYWSQLYAAISTHLVTKNGLISFSHQFLRDAIWKRYLQNKKTENSYRKKIVDYCKGQEQSHRIYDELPHQYYELRMLNELYDIIFSPRVFEYYFNENKNILYKCWKLLHDTNAEKYSIKNYYENWLKKQKNLSLIGVVIALFNYPKFLFEFKQYNESLTLYEEALNVFRKLADALPDAAVLSAVVNALCEQANLHCELQRYGEAEKEYVESLEIHRKLEAAHPNAVLLNRAAPLNGLAIVHHKLQRYGEAEKEYVESLEIYRKLAAANPEAFLPKVAETLNNLAVLYNDLNRYEEAEKEYAEVLEIYRKLVAANPEAFLPDVAMTLFNLANLYRNIHRYKEAEKE